MRRALAWVALVACGILLTAAMPAQVSAQQTEAAQAPAKRETGLLGADLRALASQSLKALGVAQEHAVLIAFSIPGGPADRAGLRAGDVILELEGTPVGPFEGFLPALQHLGAGRAVALGILRGSERLAVQVTLVGAADLVQTADHAEQRIEAAETLLRIFNRKAFPQDWARAQHDLGVAYWNRTRGDRADNQEKAIAAFEAALTVMTREAMPQEWAQVQRNLGVIHNAGNRIRGDFANNIDRAVAAFEAALTVRTPEGTPRQWAEIQHSLGVAYLNFSLNRLRGDPADNQEKAIAAFEAALTVRTREAYPREWAETQRALASVYGNRHRGDRPDNQEKAIAALEATLTVWTRETAPQEWSRTQIALAHRYGSRIRGDRAENQEKVIAAYSSALTVRTREAMPREWADTQVDLAEAYLSRTGGDRADNLEKAIAGYEAALTVRTREAMPREWQSTQTSLGNAYRARIRGDRVGNLKKAAAAYTLAADQGYAMAQDRLGLMYQKGDGVPQDFAKAIELYRNAAAQDHADASANLGWMFANGLGVARDYREAAKWYRAAGEKNIIWAQNNLAWLYRNGHGVDLDYEEGLRWSRRAAEHGDPDGMVAVGWHYEYGHGVEKNLDESFRWYERAAHKGNAGAMGNLGNMYRNGWGTQRDDKVALEWFRKGAQKGNPYSFYRIGWMYEFGRGVEHDDVEASRWYERAGEKGEIDAQERLGMLYLQWYFEVGPEGRKRLDDRIAALDRQRAEPYQGSPADYQRDIKAFRDAYLAATRDHGLMSSAKRPVLAAKWLKMAADGGSASATVRLANLLVAPEPPAHSAEPSGQDLAEAAGLYARAAAKGELAASFNLGALYEHGLGVPRDLAKAAALYREARQSAPHGAELALARLKTGDRWREELDRRAARVFGSDLAASSPAERDAPLRILVELIDPDPAGLAIDIRDEVGRRIFNGNLKRGQVVEVPRHNAPLILWSPRYGTRRLRDLVRISVGGRSAVLPAGLAAGVGIHLDAAKLLSGEGLVVDNDPGNYDEGPHFLPVSVRRRSRVVLNPVKSGRLYVRDDSLLIGYEPSHSKTFIPDIPGLKLEVHSRDSGGDPIETIYDIYVDGKNALRVRSVPNCVLTVDLDAERIKSAKAVRVAADPATCEVKGRARDRSVAIAAADGTPLGRLSKIEDDEFPRKGLPGLPVIAKFIPINYVVSAHQQWIAGRIDEARRGYQLGLAGTLRFYGPNSPHVADILQSLAEIELAQGNYDGARQQIEQAVAILEPLRGATVSRAARAYGVFAKTLLDMGRPAEAERFALKAYRQSKRTSVELGSEDYVNLASVYRPLQQPRLEKLLLLHAMLRKQVETPEATGARAAQKEIPSIGAANLLRLSRIFRNEGREKVARHVLALAHRTGKFGVGAEGLAEPLEHPLDLARFERNLGPIDSSLIAARSFEDLAVAYVDLDRPAEALPLVDRALGIRRKVLGAEHASIAGDLRLLAEAQLSLGERSRSLAAIRAAAAALTNVRKGRSHAGVRGLGLAAEAHGVGVAGEPDALAVTYARIAVKIAEAEPSLAGKLASAVFDVAQLVSDSRADEAIQRIGERFGRSDPQLREHLRRRQDLEERRDTVDLLLLRSASSPAEKRDRAAETGLREELAQLNRALADADRERKTRFPQYARLIETPALDREGAAQLLGSDEALVSFILGDRESFVLALTRDDLVLKRLDAGRKQVERMIETLRCGLDDSRWLLAEQQAQCRELVGRALSPSAEADLPFRLDVAHDLYRSLLGPVEDIIRGRNLLLVPSGPLTSLPLHVLVTRPPVRAFAANSGEYRDVAWLARTTSAAVLPSVGSLRALRAYARSSRAPEPYVAFANPLLVGTDPRKEDKSAWDALSCPAATAVASARVAGIPVGARNLVTDTTSNVDVIRRQPPLPETATEVCAVAASLGAGPAAVNLGAQAREATVKRLSRGGRLARYRTVHFATHGIMAGELYGNIEPALVMTPPAKASPEEDGLLTASEVAQLRLNADWVVLSACNTAAGESIEAEALSGLARAFFHAGARSLLVSHWYVNSLATVRLTTGAFKAMAEAARRKRPLGGAEALRRAMVEMILDREHPHYAHPANWAPFVVVGEGSSHG